MAEQIQNRPIREQGSPGPAGLDDGMDPEPQAGSVTIGSGLYYERLPVSGMTVEQVRSRFADRLDIDPQSLAVINGEPVTDERATVLAPGTTLAFVRQAGEKGTESSAFRRGRTPRASSNGTKVIVEGESVRAVSPEGLIARMDVQEFVNQLTGAGRTDLREIVLPDGIKMPPWSCGPTTVLVWEIQPQVHYVRWAVKGTGGPGSAVYKSRRLAMPFIIVLAVFVEDDAGRLVLSTRNECYFRNEPLKSPDDELCFPALLNVSKYRSQVQDSHPLSWICTQFTPFRKLEGIQDLNRRVRQGLLALEQTLLGAAFNYSSEHHSGSGEESSYWTVSARSIPQIADVDTWEKLSRKDPDFVLSLPWVKSGMSVRQIIQRIFRIHHAERPPQKCADDMARVVFNHGVPS